MRSLPRPWILALALVVVTLALAGCLAQEEVDPASSDGGLPNASVDPDVANASPPLVHDLEGRTLSPDAFPGPLPAFDQHVVADRLSTEPTVGITPDGVGFYASLDYDATTGLPRTEVYRSADAGASWEEVTPAVGPVETPPTTQDPYLTVDPVTGRVFSLDTYVGCHWLSFSDDGGDTWTTNPVACGRPGNVHHQSIVVGAPEGTPTQGYPHVVYVCQISFAGPNSCTRSLDGGLTFGPAVNTAPQPSPECMEQGEADVLNQHGGHASASLEDGTVYHAVLRCGVVTVDVSHDQGLTWEHVVVDGDRGGPPEDHVRIQPYVDTDTQGNAYMVWPDAEGRVALSVSRDQGRTWSTPVTVSAPNVEDVRYPDVQAGDPGRVAVSYVAHTGDKAWDAYVTYAVDALDLGNTTLATAQVNSPDDPLRKGECTGRCGGFYDFLDLKEDPSTGGVWMALVDMCHRPDCERMGNGTDGAEASKGAVGVQVSGIGLHAGDVVDPATASAGER